MLHVDIPSQADIKALAAHRGSICVSIYIPTTPLTQETPHDRIELKNLVKSAEQQLHDAGADKREIAATVEHIDDLIDDEEFWRLQARGLAILATPDNARTFRIPTTLQPLLEVSDRFLLKPLLRTVSFPNAAYVLALAEGGVRLIHVFADLPPTTIKVQDMPKDAPSSVGKASINHRSPSGRIEGSEGQKVRLRQYARQVDHALRGLLTGSELPLILASSQPLAPIFRSVNTYAHLTAAGIDGSPGAMTDAQLAERARAILDQLYADDIAHWKQVFATRNEQDRATTDIAHAARAATFGAVETMLVDIDEVIPGTVDEKDGSVSYTTKPGALSYGIVDEIASRVIRSGGRVIGVRKSDLPDGESLAAILRYAV
jgi:hypothetical protein